MGSLANGNSREVPSHRECHYNVPGSAPTYILCLGTRTDALSPARSEMFTLQSVVNMHIQTDTPDSGIRARWHISVWAGLSWPKLWLGVTGHAASLGSPHRRGHNVTVMPFIQCHSPMTEPFFPFCVSCIFVSSSNEVTSEPSWLIPAVSLSCVAALLPVVLSHRT